MHPSPTSHRCVERLLPVLVRIQAHLEEDLSLSQLAGEAGLSPTHFHRLFRQLADETPKQYCQRLRLERAAFRLLMSRRSILSIALDCGFASHETFARAFRKRFGVSPRQYRQARRPPRAASASGETALSIAEMHTGCEVSATRVDELEELPVAFIRHVGPYEDTDPGAWDRLTSWAARRGWTERPLLLGIAQDAPSITPPDKLRFDAALRANGPFEPDGEIGYQVVPGGFYGITTHVGPYATLERAFRTAFERLTQLRRYRVVGLPCVEIYHTTRISVDYELNQTDICVPLALR